MSQVYQVGMLSTTSYSGPDKGCYLLKKSRVDFYTSTVKSRTQAFAFFYSTISCILFLHLPPHICKMAATAPTVISLHESISIKKGGRVCYLKKKKDGRKNEEKLQGTRNPFLPVTLSGRKIFPEVPNRICIFLTAQIWVYMSPLVQLWVKKLGASIRIHP